MMTALHARLFRPRLALLNGVTALGGYALFPAPLQPAPAALLFCGVALLAMGGSALNQLQERDIDALMTRTMLRPLPRGRLSAAAAALAGAGTVLAGLALLAVSGGLFSSALGMAALVWYLAVYTPLKRRTPLALPLGAICGALPPLIGWGLAGGALSDYRIVTLAGLLFLWQIPHFWLLQERHEADYRRAGIPLVDFRTCGPGQVSLFSVWLIALAAATLLLPALAGVDRNMALWLVPVALIPCAALALRSGRFLFLSFSIFPLALNVLLIAEKLLR